MDQCNGADTPMSSTTLLDVDIKGKDFNITKYRGMIRLLLYLITSRPDIQFSMGICARYQSAPKESHAEIVKRIFRYLEDTEELGIWYPKGGNEYLIAYSDSNHAGYKTD